MREWVLVLGDNLFDGLPGIPPAAEVWMSEDRGLCTRVRHHRQKLVLFLAGMRHFRDRLGRQGRKVHYTELGDDSQADLFQRLSDDLKRESVRVLHAYEPHDRFARPELQAAAQSAGCDLVLHASPAFLTGRDHWAAYRRSQRRLLMADFYMVQRRRLGLLMNGAEPAGGKWSFDQDNRKPLPKSLAPPQVRRPAPDAVTRDVALLVDARFADHPGRGADFAYPVTHEEAAEWLEDFLSERLANFGDYEDALSTRSATVFHGVLAPLLNCGLLTPHQVLNRALAQPDVPLNSLEGFVRQIVGWREFIRWVDEEYASRPAAPNALGHTRKLKACWYAGTTGLPPLDIAIRRAQDLGWIHHIERLMVVGAAILMCEAEPAEVYRWFMEMTMDSADWVMAPNVFGMSQFADGGMFATKPYISGSSYLLKMGDYAKGPWTDVWDGLYWRFVHRHRELMANNPRMSMMALGVDRLDAARRERIFAAADEFVERTTFPKDLTESRR